MPLANETTGCSPESGPSNRAAPPWPRVHWADGLLLAAALAVLLWKLGAYGLYEPHEGHIAGVGREMLLSGDGVTPRLDGSPYLNKPPLMYWSVALSNALFGINEGSARLPLALYGWAGVLLAWGWARQLWGREAGRWAAMILTVSAGWFIFTHQLLFDVLLSVLILASLYCLWRGAREPERKKWWLAFHGSLALILLAKGPPGLIFPLLALAGFAAARRRWGLFKQAGWTWGVPLALLPVGLWAALVEARNPGFLRHVFVNEMWNRLWDRRWPPDYRVSQVSALGYLAVAAVWCAPWTVLLPQTARFAWKEAFGKNVRSGDGEGGAENGPGRQARRDAVLILALGALGPILVFLPIKSRLIYYGLPALPPFALLVAGWWASASGMIGTNRAGERNGESGTGKGGLGAAGLALAVVGAVVFSAGFWVTPLVKGIPDLIAAPDALALIPSMAWWIGGALLAGGVLLLLRKPRWAAWGLFVLMGFAHTRAAEGMASFQDVRSSKRMVAELDPKLGPDALWISEGSYELGASAGIAYYLGSDAQGRARTVRVMVDDPRRPQPQFGRLPRNYAMTREELWAAWKSAAPVVFVTDLMRRDFTHAAEAPLYKRNPKSGARDWGIERLGPPLAARYGFRRVYLNAAARKRLAAGAR